jgi:small subunit ribosomal protein S4
MSRYTGPKNRIARSLGANVFGRQRNPMLHKANAPGQHGAKRRKKSDFGLQLLEQQKLKAIYGMLRQSQLLKYYKEAVRQTGNSAHNLVQQLECRLDTLVYRLRFGRTIFHAQQLVAHGHILVNGKKVDIRSFQVKPGMTISIKPKSHNNELIKDAQANTNQEIPAYLSLEEGKLSGRLEKLPEIDQVPLALPVDIALVCEFLAHTS